MKPEKSWETTITFRITAERDTTDAEQHRYNADDIDKDYYTVPVMDGTGWPGIHGYLEEPVDCAGNKPVYKGSPLKPTKVIIYGTFLENSKGAAEIILPKQK